MPETDDRRQQILAAASAVIVRLGYDKTTMSDIAGEAGVSRGTVYLYFKGKEELFEALIVHEWTLYSVTWLELIEADPRGGTIGGHYRALIQAVASRPLISSIMRRDRRVIGNYLRKPDNVFASMSTGSLTADFLRALQAAGTVRADIDPAVMGHIIEMLSYGQLMMDDIKPADQFPPYDQVMEALADMMDRALTPPDLIDSEAGKAVIRRITTEARAQLDLIARARSGGQPAPPDEQSPPG